jgi:hypothetical protein
MNQDDYDYAEEARRDNAKRIGSAVITAVLVIAWLALKLDACESDDYGSDYSYQPSFSYTPSIPNFENTLDKSRKAIDDLMAKDVNWRPAILETDAIANAHNAKNQQCQVLDDVVDQTPSWKIGIGDYVLASGMVETSLQSPYPVYFVHEEGEVPASSPELIARSHGLIEKLVEGSDVTIPNLTMKDLLIQVGTMPKPAKGAKKVKGAIAPGKPIVRGWLYDHREDRVVCAGVMLLPDAAAGEQATRLSDEQVTKLVQTLPMALKTTPLPKVELEGAIQVEDKPKKKKDR